MKLGELEAARGPADVSGLTPRHLWGVAALKIAVEVDFSQHTHNAFCDLKTAYNLSLIVT